ncbi:MAG: membrane protein FxsA [Methanocellales archaeon]|nr:membrane protein FxsA [Methanocellales archaeon]
MLGKLILIFVLTPIMELFLLIEMGQRIGTWNVIGLVMITGIIGAFLAKSQGLSVLRKMQMDLMNGILPTDRVFDGVLILAGGILLITPGVLTDALGFILLIPLTRSWTKERLRRWLKRKIESGEIWVQMREYG